jgi:hypothetical protein
MQLRHHFAWQRQCHRVLAADSEGLDPHPIWDVTQASHLRQAQDWVPGRSGLEHLWVLPNHVPGQPATMTAACDHKPGFVKIAKLDGVLEGIIAVLHIQLRIDTVINSWDHAQETALTLKWEGEESAYHQKLEHQTNQSQLYTPDRCDPEALQDALSHSL